LKNEMVEKENLDTLSNLVFIVASNRVFHIQYPKSSGRSSFIVICSLFKPLLLTVVSCNKHFSGERPAERIRPLTMIIQKPWFNRVFQNSYFKSISTSFRFLFHEMWLQPPAPQRSFCGTKQLGSDFWKLYRAGFVRKVIASGQFFMFL
jgi:hypothetical protein